MMACTTEFSTQWRREQSVAFVAVDGRLTLADGATEFAWFLRQVLERGSRVVVDLSAVPNIDSTGLAELVCGYVAAQSRGGAIKLLRPQQRVAMLLRMAQLHRSFEIFEDEAAAIASF